MHVPVSTPQELGLVLRATRKTQGMRLDDAAAFAGVGPVFAGAVERGKATVRLGLVMKLLQQFGLKIVIDAPSEVEAELVALKAKPPRTRKKRVPRNARA